MLSHYAVCIFFFYLFFRYPSYVFISDNSISQTAALGSRYSEASLIGVILDIHFLSITDFLVCTFSSQVIYILKGMFST